MLKGLVLGRVAVGNKEETGIVLMAAFPKEVQAIGIAFMCALISFFNIKCLPNQEFTTFISLVRQEAKGLKLLGITCQ